MNKLLVVLLGFAVACGNSTGGGDQSLGQLDPRCASLCASNETACSADVAACQPLCQVRVAGQTSLCAACLLDRSNSGTCSSGSALCCPRAEFPTKVLDCASSCIGSAGVNPYPHPICTKICNSTDSACSADASACLQTCETRIQGVSGLCALCLLDGANGGTCSSSMASCCPHPEFPTSVAACASVCG